MASLDPKAIALQHRIVQSAAAIIAVRIFFMVKNSIHV